MSFFSRINWTVNRVLALAAVLLGLGAVAGDPYGGTEVTLDTEELAWIVESKVDHVVVDDLADRIVRGEVDYRLLDLRSDSAYEVYHVPTSEHVALSDLPTYPLLRNEQIILYSDGGIHSAQAWFLLRAQGFKHVYMVLGGLDAWRDEILFPSLPEHPGPDQLANVEKRRYLSDFFGGTPVHGQVDSAAQQSIQLPKLDNSARPVIVRPKKKKRKEGC